MELNEELNESTQSVPSDIKRVSKETVHKICSSQVILNLAIGVKELVENSVDAGSSVIEIKIKDYGLDGFEVSDNGSGIEESNFEGITAKHHTSKLKQFEDLQSLKTFGFRGEALSSFCALSNVIITTRHKSSQYGTKMSFDHEGKIIEKSITARNVGTTVSVSDFFKTLPVRKCEFQKNYKKDFNKMVQLLQEYCLVLQGVKIICTNHAKSGSRTTVLTTNGNSVMDNIISIFGMKQSQELIKIKNATSDGTENGTYTQESLVDLDDPNSILDIQWKEVEGLNKGRFKLEGFVSNIEHSSGRSSKDRQFFYVNSRPVEIRPIIKIINDVYHRYNAKHFPFVYLNLKMDQSNVDINLSKDKRQVAICDDKILMYVVKRSLLNTYGELPSKLKFTSVNKVVQVDSEESEDEDDKVLVLQPTSNFSQSLKQWKLTPNDPTPRSVASPSKRKLDQTSPALRDNKTRKIDTIFKRKKEDDEEVIDVTDDQDENVSLNASKTEDISTSISCKTITTPNTLKFEFRIPKDIKPGTARKSNISTILKKSVEDLDSEDVTAMEEEIISEDLTDDEDTPTSSYLNKKAEDLNSEDVTAMEEDFIKEIIEVDTPKVKNPFRRKIKISLDEIAKSAKAEEELQERLDELSKNKSFKLRFKEKIDPSKSKKAEVELETEIKKESFEKMEVLGQFNLGFIIAKLESDLFIVDQHATDERYNFEDLQKSLKIETQKMLVPEKLELTAIQEETIIENLSIFELNGFRFDINKEAEATKRIALASRPYSKNWEFGREDIEEMIFNLQDAPMTICRPSRIRSMLASRACRKSIMIGDPLNHNQMKKLLKHMGEIDHPWNCPHGRPTIRFLQNVDFIDQK